MKAWEQLTNIVGVFLLVVCAVLVLGYPGFAAEHPHTFVTAAGHEISTGNELIAVGLLILLLFVSLASNSRSGALVMAIVLLVVLAFASRVNPF